ncbi:uncharacterized protein MELLADRAFT_76427 [Melampsora larici-populina 98AG31]|uniref:Uncharacterized protein n=1 Tax=Melampsora larici-populina (strain 98AG31 / pathotype 3-4-7) TaxID=747676 RepID=F4R665_MELLP|nr:uncharacterized protein MELLADRAFT_76427 [Melampsora larici-populina 98AG31]EGG12522.1 hypothetical protein MELLADRAFT_76427 [Melampsora larici-populina 98AG31]
MSITDPPLYNLNNPINNHPFLINLTTLSPTLSFLSGYLGVTPAFVQGELQLKIISTSNTFLITQVSLTFSGLESNHQLQSIDFLQLHQILWEHQTTHHLLNHHHSSQPSCSNTPNHHSKPPSNLPFQFSLTPDLPHCIHLPNGGGLHYELDAHITYTNSSHLLTNDHHQPDHLLEHLHLKVPVHISRYSNPAIQLLPPPSPQPLDQNQQPFTLSPVRLTSLSPTPIYVSLSQTLLRHSEPLALQVRIPPPTEELIREKGLRLRSVRAELHQHIRIQSSIDQENGSSTTERSSTGAPPYDASSGSTNPESTSDDSSSSSNRVITSLLAISGKSCRFSSTRSVFLRLTLQPHRSELTPVPSSTTDEISPVNIPQTTTSGWKCNSISQSTLLHQVSFSVTITIQISGRGGERFDVELNQAIGVVPDWPPVSEDELPAPLTLAASGKAREAAEEQAQSSTDQEWEEAPAPTYFETDEPYNFPGTSSTSQTIRESHTETEEEEEDEEEEEYDGYESFSSLAGQGGPAPPTIDEDESPPPAPDTPPDGIQLDPTSTDPSSSVNQGSFEFVCFDEATARFGNYVVNPSLPNHSTSSESIVPTHPIETETETQNGTMPPAYAVGWASLNASSSRSDQESIESNQVNEVEVRNHLNHNQISDNNLNNLSSVNAPPPYADDFGSLLIPVGSIGVVRQDGELGGFLMRREGL